MAEDQDLGILRRLAAAEQLQPAKDLGDGEVQESDRHRPRSCPIKVSGPKPQVTAAASNSGAVQVFDPFDLTRIEVRWNGKPFGLAAPHRSAATPTPGQSLRPVPPEYSIEPLTCAIASGLAAVMVGWPGAAQDRLSAGVPPDRRGRAGVPRRPGECC